MLQTVLVVFPLKSIIEDQIAESQRMGILFASAANVSDEELQTVDFEWRMHDNMSRVVSLVSHFDFPAGADWFKYDS